MLTLSREGDLTSESKGIVDSLRMTYDGMRLTAVQDYAAVPSVATSMDFRDGASADVEYTYDACGRLISDLNKGIASISYDAVGQPAFINAGNHAELSYYLPDGTKVRRTEAESDGRFISQFKTTDYRGNAVYVDGDLHYLLTDSGLIGFAPLGTEHLHFVKDHLGNVRSVIDLKETTVAAAVKEQSDYLPFGTRIAVTTGSGASDNRWRYAGKEEQRFGSGLLGIDLAKIDFGARFYDPDTARWTTPDPLASKYPFISPYAYCGNDPVNRFDPDGSAWLPVTNEGGELDYLWIPEELSFNKDGTLKEGLYHQAIIFTNNHTFDKDNNLGSSTAIVHLSDGSIETFDACTIPSDVTKYPTVPAGRYEAAVGIHTGSSGKGYTALKMFDIGNSLANNKISLGVPNVAHPDRDYIEGADIHKAGKNEYTGMTSDGSPVSAACFLISRNKDTWNSFIGLFNNNEQKSNIISISVIR